MRSVKVVNCVNVVPKCDERSDNRTRAGSKYKIKALVQRALHQTLDLFENAKGVEPLGASAVKGKNPTKATPLVLAGREFPHAQSPVALRHHIQALVRPPYFQS